MATNKNFVVKNGLEVGGNVIVTGNITQAGLVFPNSDGTSGQYLQTDGSGNLTWNSVVSSFNVSNGTTTDQVNTGETLTFTGGTNITVSVTDNGITFDNDIADSDDITEGASNLFFTETRAVDAIEGHAHLTIDGGTLYVDTDNNYVGIGDTSPQHKLDVAGGIGINGTEVIDSGAEVITARLKDSGVTAGSYGSASLVPVITVDAKGRITSASTTSVAGVSSFSFNGTSEVLTINTADGGTYTADISALASESYVATAISNLVDSAPGTLDTLNELAAALGDDPNFATTVATAINGKVEKSGDTMTGELNVDAQLKANQLRLSKNGDSTSIGATIGLSNAGGDTNSNDITITAANSTNSIVFRSAINIDAQTYQSGSWNSRLKILQNGNVGIGTSSPASSLDVKGNFRLTRNVVAGDVSEGNWLFNISHEDSARYGSLYLVPSVSTAEIDLASKVRIKNNGNVGIGTTNPTNRFHVDYSVSTSSANIAESKSTAAIAYAPLRNGSSYGMYFGNTNYSSGYTQVTDGTNTGSMLINPYGGNVGIGTTNPSVNLEVSNSSNPFILVKNTTSGSGLYIKADNDGDTELQTAGGTNNIVLRTAGTERVRLDGSGKMGIGTSDISDARLSIHGTGSSNYNALQIRSSDSNGVTKGGVISFAQYDDASTSWSTLGGWDNGSDRIIYLGGGGWGPQEATEFRVYTGSYDAGTSGAIQRMEIDSSGNLAFGSGGYQPGNGNTNSGIGFRAVNTATSVMLSVSRTDGNAVRLNYNGVGSSGGSVLNWSYNGGSVGSVVVDSNGTTYNTTSDRRLKDNITTITNGKEKLLAMNPVTHTWKADPNGDAVHGFIAQEMQEVVPEAVSGEPDGDDMMSMDYGRITPVIVAALQDALKEIEELKTRINELEAK